jgi:citrate lyase gamma subunit
VLSTFIAVRDVRFPGVKSNALALTITCKAIEKLGPNRNTDVSPQRDEAAAGESGEHRRPTLADVAREANVSTSTVSRVLNDYGASSQKARARVEAAMRRVDYKPNEAARIMVHSKRTKQSVFAMTPLHDSAED